MADKTLGPVLPTVITNRLESMAREMGAGLATHPTQDRPLILPGIQPVRGKLENGRILVRS